jgi:hypothetical protein
MQHTRWKIKFFLLGKHCIAIDKDKSCEHENQKFWFLKPSQISEVILNSNNNEPKGDTVTIVEEGGFEVFYLSNCYNRSVTLAEQLYSMFQRSCATQHQFI